MKILHLNSKDISGGAARATFRIHNGLLKQGIDSRILVQKKESNLPSVISPYDTKFKKVLGILRPYVNTLIQKFQNTSNPILHSANVLPSGLHKIINKSDADIVHIHWVNREMISIKEISKIKKPIIWTLHDMWAFSGAEHCDDLNFPDRYKEGYKRNNRPSKYSGFDIDRWTWKRKKKYWHNMNFNFVTPSYWLAKCLRQSALFKGKQAKVIANGLDTDIFKPTNQNKAREILNIPLDKSVVLYGATDAENNPVKGYDILKETKAIIKCGQSGGDLHFVVFGNDYKKKVKKNGIITEFFGRIHDDILLSLIYSAADVMVVPSVMEAFGQTVSEAMACGTPVVAFNATGPIDIIDHKNNGYLANPYDPQELAAGIEWILKDKSRIKILSKNARKKAVKKFDIKEVTNQYLNLYRKILEE